MMSGLPPLVGTNSYYTYVHNEGYDWSTGTMDKWYVGKGVTPFGAKKDFDT
jgi:hypothetical protein